MACCEFECTECSWAGFGNATSASCPKCGARCSVTFDEPPDDGYDSDRYEDDDGDLGEEDREQGCDD